MTTTMKLQETTLEITRTLKAPVEKVWKAWTEPQQITKWFGCAKTGEAKVTQDLRVGGSFRVEMHCTDGEVPVVHGEYKEVIENQRLVYTWTNNSIEYPAENTLVTVEFIPKGNETELKLRHENFVKPVSAQGHSFGWGDSLEKFAALFESDK